MGSYKRTHDTLACCSLCTYAVANISVYSGLLNLIFLSAKRIGQGCRWRHFNLGEFRPIRAKFSAGTI